PAGRDVRGHPHRHGLHAPAGAEPQAERNLTAMPEENLTPVGDYLTARFGGGGTVHWNGIGDMPGCDAEHPLCAYRAAWRELGYALCGELDAVARTLPLASRERLAYETASAVALKRALRGPS